MALAMVVRGAEEGAFLEVVRARIDTLPVLEPGAAAGAPSFKVIRLNAPSIVVWV